MEEVLQVAGGVLLAFFTLRFVDYLATMQKRRERDREMKMAIEALGNHFENWLDEQKANEKPKRKATQGKGKIKGAAKAKKPVAKKVSK